MESLTTEGQAIFDTISSTTVANHAQQKKEISDLIVQAVNAAMDSTVHASIDKAVDTMQVYADGVESTLQQRITNLQEQVGLAAHTSDPDPRTKAPGGDAETGLDGRHSSSTTRGPSLKSSGLYIPPPARGIRQNHTSVQAPRSFDVHDEYPDSPPRGRVPRIDFPKFDGENPQLWQIRCEDFFELYDTSPRLWVKLAFMQFTSPAARWLNSIKSFIRKLTWEEFCQEVLLRFGRNQHQSLIRCIYKFVQTGSVEEYVSQLSELVDQLAAYEAKPDPLHYVTRFLEGLKPAVRVLVAVQLPQDLDTSYYIALVQEEVGDGFTILNSSTTPVPRKQFVPQAIVAKPMDDRSLSCP
uniref:Uncharacterized protein n=1 Tax=Avena sativa TaxID=4498 RepID=A0ACD5ZH15_AVESA